MEQAEGFTDFNRRRNRYPWRRMLDEGGVWQLRRGEDYTCLDVSLKNAAYAWARKRGCKATVSRVEPGLIEVQITRRQS